MTKPELTDLIRLARAGANYLGQSAPPQHMLQIWTIIANAEAELAKQDEPNTGSISQQND